MQRNDQKHQTPDKSVEAQTKCYSTMLVNAVRVHMREKGIRSKDLAIMIAVDEGHDLTDEARINQLQQSVSRFLNRKQFNSNSINRILKHLQISEIRVH